MPGYQKKDCTKMTTSKNNLPAVTDISLETALAQNTMPTPEQWVRVKSAIQTALKGPLHNGNMVSRHSPAPNAHYIGVYPGDYEELMDALEFTTNDDLDIV